MRKFLGKIVTDRSRVDRRGGMVQVSVAGERLEVILEGRKDHRGQDSFQVTIDRKGYHTQVATITDPGDGTWHMDVGRTDGVPEENLGGRA